MLVSLCPGKIWDLGIFLARSGLSPHGLVTGLCPNHREQGQQRYHHGPTRRDRWHHCQRFVLLGTKSWTCLKWGHSSCRDNGACQEGSKSRSGCSRLSHPAPLQQEWDSSLLENSLERISCSLPCSKWALPPHQEGGFNYKLKTDPSAWVGVGVFSPNWWGLATFPPNFRHKEMKIIKLAWMKTTAN